MNQTVRKWSSTLFSRQFWDSVGVKIVESLISVKVWGLIAITTISSIFLYHDYIGGGDWVTVNGTVYGVIYGMREVFKITRIKTIEEMYRSGNGNAPSWEEVEDSPHTKI